MTTSRDTITIAAEQRPAAPLNRLAPLTGVAFFVLLMGAAIAAGPTPGAYDSGAKVLRIFAAHEGAERVSNLLDALGVVFLVFFAGILRAHLRQAGALATVAFGGLVVLATGGAARAGVGWALASGHDHLDPSTAQTLNVIFYGHYPAIVGIAIFMFAAWLAVLRTRALPLWLGWLALPIGLAAIAPPTLAPLIASGLWIAVAGVVVTVRGPVETDRA
ncbi:MAG: hypothetical protein JWO46_1611 [Nocardioidaceae bacterium]|nr:hypothetical protein [Nocardioidaceae bacterium]